tara:strand:+ start:692 stop:850 length:159 start_codon:yes stop_codon:yes gene_type:complete
LVLFGFVLIVVVALVAYLAPDLLAWQRSRSEAAIIERLLATAALPKLESAPL